MIKHKQFVVQTLVVYQDRINNTKIYGLSCNKTENTFGQKKDKKCLIALRDQSKSTLNNYLRRTRIISLHFKRLPENILSDEVNEYLTVLVFNPKSPSSQ